MRRFTQRTKKIGQLIGLKRGKLPRAKHNRLNISTFPNFGLGAITKLDIDIAVLRWVSGFHAALYRQPASDSRASIVTPFPKAKRVGSTVRMQPIRD
jgi:hypothetical protein